MTAIVNDAALVSGQHPTGTRRETKNLGTCLLLVIFFFFNHFILLYFIVHRKCRYRWEKCKWHRSRYRLNWKQNENNFIILVDHVTSLCSSNINFEEWCLERKHVSYQHVVIIVCEMWTECVLSGMHFPMSLTFLPLCCHDCWLGGMSCRVRLASRLG